ncbi:MAG TPA: hypothetical protein VFJ65_06765 [Solirubrobacterales bacterium]|nr:hypothetical protein [Solirubrobacterales bacterium]
MSGNGATVAEIHNFSYFSCLLSVYDGRSAADWGYDFYATPTGSPYARILDAAIRDLSAAGFLLPGLEALALSTSGEAVLGELERHALAAERMRYLDAAAGAAALVPLPTVTRALAQEPQLRRVFGAPTKRDLLDEAGYQLVRPHFQVLAEAFEEQGMADADLALSGAIWLMALTKSEEEGE